MFQSVLNIRLPTTQTGLWPIIACNIHRGNTDEQKDQLGQCLMKAIGEPIEDMFLAIREMPGCNFVDPGEHVAEYVPGEGGVDGASAVQLRNRGLEE
ncbi:Tautomerase enzyme [Mycobacteroides abscessus subsp. abscessus]|nr:Tautomerase enzyme [Mycobacteroides abscessus subsp. abscessus]